MTDDDPFVHFDGAYVLGSLDDADRAAFEYHLAECDACRDRVAEVRGTADLIAALRPDLESARQSAHEAGPEPDTLLPGLLRMASRERRRRRFGVAAIAGVAAACLVTLVITLWPGSSSGPSPQALTPVRKTHIQATAVLVDHPWGTQIDLKCKYETADYTRTPTIPYDLKVVDKDNNSYDGGGWTLVPGKTLSWTGGVEVRRERIAKVLVTLPDGTTLLQLSL